MHVLPFPFPNPPTPFASNLKFSDSTNKSDRKLNENHNKNMITSTPRNMLKMTQLNIPPAQRIEQIDLFIWYDLLSPINKQYFIINCNNSKLLHAHAHMVRVWKFPPSASIWGIERKIVFLTHQVFVPDSESSRSLLNRRPFTVSSSVDAIFSQSTISFLDNNKLRYAHV